MASRTSPSAGDLPVRTTDLVESIARTRVVAIATLQDAGSATALVEALVEGGLAIVEITLRTAAGIEALRTVRVPGAILGAGTVTTASEATTVIEAGAQFVVSPGLDLPTVRTCQEAGIPVFPGVATPSEVMVARSMGLRTVKVFPAGPLGGPGFIRSLASVWPDMAFMPTGGVSLANAADYLQIPSVIAVGGSWIVAADRVAAQDWAGITESARAAGAIQGRST